MLAIIPMERVTAKPLMGPVPNCSRARAAKSVVTFASSIVRKAFPKPSCIAALGFSVRLISYLIRWKINTFASTAMPMVKTIPAMPGKVNVAPKAPRTDIIKIILKISATTAKTPARR